MDFIFGTFATDDLKLVHHRTARRGVQHGFDITPRDPQPGRPVTLTVQVGTDLSADHVAVYYTTDGTIPAGTRGTATRGQVVLLEQVATEWDAVAWGYVTRWQGALPAQPEGTVVRYRVSAWDDTREVFGDWPNVRDTAERAAAAFFRGEEPPPTPPGNPQHGDTFSYPVDRLGVPGWARDAVIYQVFVDRFYPGDGRDWQPARTLRDFFGGTLWGVRDKLDYIAELGATAIWLSPTWKSPTHHGYDVVDYHATEPRLGGDEALYALVEAAHARGLRVLLDMVCNHVSDRHPYFRDACADPGSPYRAWFTFDPAEPHGYRTFFGVASMPAINTAHPDARVWLLDIARYWIREFDVDGYRLDYANGPGPDFWVDFRAACRAEKPDAFCFGEIVDQPAALLPYIGRLDGCLDFHIGEAIRKTYAYGTWSESDLARFVARHEAYFEGEGDFIRPTFIDNHDMDRFLYAANGDRDALRRAAAFQMRLPGPPVIYYGTEVGLNQRSTRSGGMGLEVSREPMPWGDDQDRDLLAYYQSLVAARQRR